MGAGLQCFKINPDGTTTEVKSDGPLKDVLRTDECYVIVADDIRKVILWKGISSNVRSKFIGAKRSQEIRGQVGLHYSGEAVDEGDESPEILQIMGGKTEGGIAKEIKEDAPTGGAHPLREKPIFAPPSPAEGMNIAGSRGPTQNTGPLYTGSGSMATYIQEESQVNFEQIMQKLEQIELPAGYERELIIIGSNAYSIVEKVQTFLGKKQVEKVIERVGSIPEGVFFAKDYSPRVLSENGKILAIEFLKRAGGGAAPSAAPTAAPKAAPKAPPKDKKDILKDQLRNQLGGA